MLMFVGCSALLADESPDLVLNSDHAGQYAVELYSPGGGIFHLTSTGSITDNGGSRPALTTDPHPATPVGWRLIIDGTINAEGPGGTGIGLYGPDSLLIGNGASVSADSTGIYVASEGTTIENRGDVSGGSHGILANKSLNLINAEGATINGPIQMVVPGADGGYVDNAGTISGGSLMQIVLRGDSTLINRQSGKILTSNNGLYVADGRGTVQNDGVIASSPDVGDATSYSGVYLHRSGSVENTGTITGPIGVRFGNSGSLTAGTASLVNSGEIIGASLYPVLFWNVEEAVLTNTATGSLKGGLYGVFISGTPKAEIVNAGVISGSTGIALSGAGTRTIINTGEIVGTGGTAIRKTGGTYELILGTGSQISGIVEADASDILRLEGSGSEDDSLLGFGLVTMEGDAWALHGEVSGRTLDIGKGALTIGSDGVLSFTDTMVRSGSQLAANGTLSGTLEVFGRLSGTGTIGTTRIAAGGLHTPGNSIGTQVIDGDYTNNGVLQIEATPVAADRIVVNGAVDISGASLDLVLSPTSSSDWNILNGPFTIIANDGDDAITGTFTPVSKNLVFLDHTLDYAGGDGNDLVLQLVRNDVEFADVGETRNQKAAANGLDSLGQGSMLWSAIALQNDEASVRASFDSLSGEIHASVKTALIEDSANIRKAVTGRTRAAFGGGSPDVPVLAYGPGGAAIAAADVDRFAVWGQAFGTWGSFDSDGNAASLETTSGGLLVGADAPVGDWRLGMLAGYSQSSFDVDARASSGDSNNIHLGLYGGTKKGPVGFRFGSSYSWHDIETERVVTLPALSETLSAAYDAASAQVFGELSYKIGMGSAAIEPFAGLAYVTVDSDAFTEAGGAAALSSPGGSSDATFTTLGVRASTDFTIGGTIATARAMLGWRHAFGDPAPLSNHAFAGGDAFVIAGAPIAENALVLEAGVDVSLSQKAFLGLSYSGQIADGASDHGARASLTVSF